MYYLFSENTGADQLSDYLAADLRLCACAKSDFSHDAAHRLRNGQSLIMNT